MEKLATRPDLAPGQTSPQGGSRAPAVGRPKKPMPAVMRWIRPRRSGQSWQEKLQNHRNKEKANDGAGSVDTDASPTTWPDHWKAIHWPSIRQQVRRLQMRIAKATQAGSHRKA